MTKPDWNAPTGYTAAVVNLTTVSATTGTHTHSGTFEDMDSMSLAVTLTTACNVSVMLLGDDPGAGVDGTMRIVYGVSTQVGADHQIDAGSARVMHVYVANLAAGAYTFKAQYLTSNTSSTTNMVNRTMTVMAVPV